MDGGASESNLPPAHRDAPGIQAKRPDDTAGPSSSGASGRPEPPPGKRLKQVATDIIKCPQMKRPGYGVKGQKVDLHCNHFKVHFKPSEPVYHYNVTIEPVMRSGVNRKVMTALYATYGQEFLRGKQFAYDGENSLFIVGDLTSKRTEFPVVLDDEPGRGRNVQGPGGNGSPNEARRGRPSREFLVRIAYASTIDMKTIDAVLRGERNDRAQDALRVLDIVLREHAAKRSYLLLKESYFHPDLGQVQNIGEGVQLWRGFHVSFRPTSGGLSLNFDISTTLVIQPGPVMGYIENQLKKRAHTFGHEDWMKAKRLLKSIMVVVKYSGRKHKIIGFSPESSMKQTFPKRVKGTDGANVESVEITVAHYFEVERGLKLAFPHYPALDVGRASKPVYLPIELCDIIPGQRYKRSLTTFQRQAQIDHTRQPPEIRKRLALEAMKTNNYNEDELVREFNVHIEQNMKCVPGRILEAPKLMFGNRFEETPRNGRWNFGSKKMHKPVEIPNWGVACFRGRMPLDARNIATQLRNVCAEKGMKLGEFVLVEEEMQMRNAPPQQRVSKVILELAKHLEQYTKNAVPDKERPFILAILPDKSPDLYVPFKKMCEVKVGIVTQCIVPPKGQVNPKYLTSVSLKINLKRGGYNSVLSSEVLKSIPKISQVPTIIFGLDVSHGSAGDNSPSVAAAVATVDWPLVSRYTTSIRAQAAKSEMIEGLYETKDTGMVRELLMNFYKFENRNIRPQQIVIFRDGVSESQFEQVLDKELVDFKRACASLHATYEPRITLIVVQKRHHTRFFPANGRGNVVPGTIVDRDPCHPLSHDFYLCSHAGIIGTTRPTHYHVLYDEIGFTPDELQAVTNSLCYSYTRCTSAVSVVAPAYYAHLAAQHCRSFGQDNFDSGSESSLTTARLQQAIHDFPKPKDSVLKKMFYA